MFQPTAAHHDKAKGTVKHSLYCNQQMTHQALQPAHHILSCRARGVGQVPLPRCQLGHPKQHCPGTEEWSWRLEASQAGLELGHLQGTEGHQHRPGLLQTMKKYDPALGAQELFLHDGSTGFSNEHPLDLNSSITGKLAIHVSHAALTSMMQNCLSQQDSLTIMTEALC